MRRFAQSPPRCGDRNAVFAPARFKPNGAELMKTHSPTFTAQTGAGHQPSGLLRFLLGATVFLLMSAYVFAAPRDRGRKIAPIFEQSPSNPNALVDVIIQFNQTPQAKHFQMLATKGGKLKFKLSPIKGAAYRIPVRMLAFLEAHPDIGYVTPDRPNKPSFDDGASQQALANIALQQSALDGSGIGIAIIDSGVYHHDDLSNANGSRIVYSESFVNGDSSTDDAYGHGTHVAGIVAGNGLDSQSGYAGQFAGIAPNANIINLRVLDQNGAGPDSQVIAAIQRAIQLKDTYNIRIINLSLGRPVYESYTLD